MVIALTTPAFADIPDYESMHKRLADVCGGSGFLDSGIS